MLPDFPFALPIDFQSSTIDDQMDRLPGRFDRQVYLQPGLPTRQRRVVGRWQIQPHQAKQRLDKALGLTQRQIKQRAKRQRRFNGKIRVVKLGPALGRPPIAPAINGFLAQPYRQVTPMDQCLIIGRPVFHPIDHFLLRGGCLLARRTMRRYVFHYRLLGECLFLAKNPSQV